MSPPHGRILCTEDDADTRELIVLMLGYAGFEVICADNAEKTIDLIKTESFDLCLLDNWLPGASGQELCRKIREFDSRTPILFYSGAAFDSDMRSARASGAQGYLVKPASENTLIAEVMRLIAESKVMTSVASTPDNSNS